MAYSSFFALLAVVTFSASANASVTCQDLFQTRAAGVVDANAVAQKQAAELWEKASQGLSDRGIISSRYPLTPELASEAAKKGMMHWYLRIYLARNLAEAKRHAETELDPLMQGVYLIDPKLTEASLQQPPAEVFNRLFDADGMVFFKTKYQEVDASKVDVASDPLRYLNNQDGVLVERTMVMETVDAKYVRENFEASQVLWDRNDPERGNYLFFGGYSFPKVRGVIRYEDTIGSKTYDRMRKLAAKLIASGYTVRFNSDFKRSLDMVRDQKRRVGGEWVQNSRYVDKATYDTALESFALGRAYSVEVWNEKGQLVGGMIGNRQGSIYSPDSVFYDVDGYANKAIDFAKISVVAMMDRLQAAGIPFADAGMVSHFTNLMKGRLYDSSVFVKLIESLPPESQAVVDMKTNWTP